MARLPMPNPEPMKLVSLAEIARGGMGSVELARVIEGKQKGQLLAIKRLHASIAQDPEFVSMFLDEAWMTAALRHPNVVQVVALGEDERGRFLAIELVQGVSLSRLLKESRQNQEPFAERSVAYICSQICAGLTAAHTLSGPDGSPMCLVHRDLTPANVLVSFDGHVKIIDFGIAKAEERISHTRTGQLKGKPAYMAPEQQRGAAVDARTDVFSFGVLMFELLAGRRPWTAKGTFDVMMAVSNDPHPDLGELRRGLNPEFIDIVNRCLAKKPDDRIGSAAEIKARLDAWLNARGFSVDDQRSLADFVVRNSTLQVKWWKSALNGELQKKEGQTFKELEEKIDDEREKAAKARARSPVTTPMPVRPAAGVPAPSPPQSPVPARQSLSPLPSSGPMSPRSTDREAPISPVAPSHMPSLPSSRPRPGYLFADVPPSDGRALQGDAPSRVNIPAGSVAGFGDAATSGSWSPQPHPVLAPRALVATLPSTVSPIASSGGPPRPTPSPGGSQAPQPGGPETRVPTLRPPRRRSVLPIVLLVIGLPLVGAGIFTLRKWEPALRFLNMRQPAPAPSMANDRPAQ